MDRSGPLRFLIFAGLGLLLFFGLQRFMGGGSGERQPLGRESQKVPAERAPNRLCDIYRPEFFAEIQSRGGTLTHFELLTAKYRRDGKPLDLSTTPNPAGDHEFRQQLFSRWRPETEEAREGKKWNVDFDSFDYEIAENTAKRCRLVYESDAVRLEKTIETTGRPYELEVKSTIENRSNAKRAHAFRIDTVAWRLDSEVEGKMFRLSPYVTHVECMPQEGKAVRLRPDDFSPGEFKEPQFSQTNVDPGTWYQAEGAPAFAAVSNAYFAHALVPLEAPETPACLLQIEYRWDYTRYESKKNDPNAGAMYRARLAYPTHELAPGQSATYSALTYIGPKERDILAHAAGGNHRLIDLIDLGFFSAIAKILVSFLLAVYGVVSNWGLAIIILTVTARILLFPLSWPQIKNMVRMRELKPEMDALNEKYKDDAQARGLAQMELWRKHKVNPLKGCLPQLASMPVWLALYTTLQTAVELYNIPFLWFPDLSESDPLFILPFIIGATFFLQQTVMPMQGGDPMQQKMMRYFMPGMFTVFMLFLPSGLGVYMFTNSLLAIGQQWVVQRYTKRALSSPDGRGAIEVTVKEEPQKSGSETRPRNKKKKGKKGAKSEGSADDQDVSGGRPLLDKGKA